MARPTSTEQGFTLIELLVVIGILAILLAITLIAINPTKHFQDSRNAQRQSDVVAILDGIYEYEAANTGTIPATLASVSTNSASPSPIASSGSGFVNPCADLVPTYLADLPKDPSTGTRSASTTCGGTFSTGYTIYKSASSSRFTVAAPSAENSVTISVTR
jgi:type IV pilus assembly protein PilA